MITPRFLLAIVSLSFTHASVVIEGISVWPDAHDSATRFSSDKGTLREIHEIQENGRIELNIAMDGKASQYKHVGLLLQDKGGSAGMIGSHPSIHIPMNSTGGSSKTFKAVFDLSGMRTVNPDGSTLQVSVLIVPESGSAPVRKDIGKLRLVKSSSRQDPVVVGDNKKIIPELSSFVPAKVIKHMFKPEPARSAPFYSVVFTGLTLAVPVLLLLLGLWKMGVNVKGIKYDGISRVMFTGLIGAFIALMGAFFAVLNLVQTTALFLVLLAPLVLVGNRVLCQLRASGDIRDDVYD